MSMMLVKLIVQAELNPSTSSKPQYNFQRIKLIYRKYGNTVDIPKAEARLVAATF